MATIREIAEYLSGACDIHVLDRSMLDSDVNGIASTEEAGAGELTFLRASFTATEETKLRASVLIADTACELDTDALCSGGVVLLARCENARLEFCRVAARFFTAKRTGSIHPRAEIHPEARVGNDCVIDSGAYVGRATIGDGCVIGAGARILDGVTLGSDCTVYANAVIGADGFGFERDADGIPVKFPQRGCVLVGDRVEVGACACIDRGALSDTVIADDVKIDNLVHVAHNARIGRATMIAANAVIAGSAVLGERVWVGPSASISNGLSVGDDACVTLGAVVTAAVPAGARVSGNFAVDHERFLSFLRSIR